MIKLRPKNFKYLSQATLLGSSKASTWVQMGLTSQPVQATHRLCSSMVWLLWSSGMNVHPFCALDRELTTGPPFPTFIFSFVPVFSYNANEAAASVVYLVLVQCCATRFCEQNFCFAFFLVALIFFLTSWILFCATKLSKTKTRTSSSNGWTCLRGGGQGRN